MDSIINCLRNVVNDSSFTVTPCKVIFWPFISFLVKASFEKHFCKNCSQCFLLCTQMESFVFNSVDLFKAKFMMAWCSPS